MEQILAVIEVIPLERSFERTEEQIDDLTVQQVELDKVTLQEGPHFRAHRGEEFDLAVPQVVVEALEVVNAISQNVHSRAHRGAECCLAPATSRETHS